ncbi:MAG TPA: YceI family protein [Candidatus Dormibacteraeota bacterium]|nr:YceI family protein [Candidatus Dormibacteraeota bacterium]
MRKRLVVIVGAVAGIAVAAFAALYAYVTLSNRDAPPPVSLTPQTPIAAATSSGTAPSAATSSGSASGGAAGTSCDTAAVDGTWTVSTASGQSFAGYRVTERLASLPAQSDAVGRTTAVSGTVTIAGTNASAADVTADLTRLTSNEQRRDNFIRQNGLESDTYPTAEFKLSSSLSFGSVPATGRAVSATAHGQLTLHGRTRSVDIPVQAQRTCAGIEIVGSLPVTFSDYGMSPPSIGGFVSVEDHGTMELKLELVRSA